MADFSTKYLTFRGSDPRNPLAQLQIDLADAEQGLAEAKAEGDTRVMRLMQGRIRAAKKQIAESGTIFEAYVQAWEQSGSPQQINVSEYAKAVSAKGMAA